MVQFPRNLPVTRPRPTNKRENEGIHTYLQGRSEYYFYQQTRMRPTLNSTRNRAKRVRAAAARTETSDVGSEASIVSASQLLGLLQAASKTKHERPVLERDFGVLDVENDSLDRLVELQTVQHQNVRGGHEHQHYHSLGPPAGPAAAASTSSKKMKTTAAATARTSTTGSHSQLASMSSTTSTEIAASGTLFSPHKQFLDANNLPMLQSNYKSFQLHGMNLNENNPTSAVDVVPAAVVLGAGGDEVEEVRRPTADAGIDKMRMSYASKTGSSSENDYNYPNQTMTTTATTRSSAHSNVAVAGVGNKNRYTEKELVQDLERPCGSGYTSYPAVVTDACCHQTDMFAWGRSPARGMFGGADRDHVKNSTNGDGNVSRAEKSEREQDQEDEGAFASPLSANLNLAIFRCDRTRKIGGGRRKHQLGSSLNLLCKREADVIGNARELDSSVANVPAAGFLAASEGSSYSYNSTSTRRRSSLGGESMRELLRHDEVAVPAESGSHDAAGTMKAKQGRGTKMGLRREELENNAVLVLPVSPTCKGKGARAFEDREEVNERRQERFASTTQRAECGRKSWRSSQKNPKSNVTGRLQVLEEAILGGSPAKSEIRIRVF